MRAAGGRYCARSDGFGGGAAVVVTIVCLGDSIVEGEGDELGLGGWVGRINQKIGHPWNEKTGGLRLYNLGIGGNTVRDVNYRLGEVLVRKPDILILGCGGNDVKKYLLPDGTYERCLADFQVKKNWHEVLDKLKQICPKVLVLGGHNIADPAAGDEVIIRHQDKAQHMLFVKALCKEKNLAFMEPVKYQTIQGLFSHGSHPNAAGYDIYAEAVYVKLQELGWVDGQSKN
jgi:lysophospholipase L1-like esterase